MIMKDETKTITIKDALTFPEGTPIPRLVGRLEMAWERKEGVGDYGPWSSQSGLISNEDGSKMVFTVWNKPEIPKSYAGKTLIFRSGTGKKPTMTLKSDYKDKSKRTLNVSKSCFVMTEEEETDDIPMGDPEPRKEAQYDVRDKERARDVEDYHKSLHAKPKGSLVSNNGLDQDFVRHRLMQFSNLYKVSYGAAKFAVNGKALDEEYVKDVATTLFIQACKENLADKLPDDKPIEEKNAAKVQEPEPAIAPEDIVF
jgi:hypothetical protein